MRLVVGLGNPGKTYARTRHNVGFMVVDRLAGKGEWTESKKGQLEYIWFDVQGENIELIKPLTMMNNSGKAVAYAKRKHPALRLDDLYVVHDDLDIPLGNYKIQLGKGPRVHGGLQSIYQHLGSEEFWHVRLGIGGKQFQEVKSQKSPKIRQLADTGRAKVKSFGKEYVLQRFEEDELPVIKRAVSEVVQVLAARLLG